MREIREPAVADMFYTGNGEKLEKEILSYLDLAEDKDIPGCLKAVILPHAGYLYSAPTAAYAYKLFKKLDQGKRWKILLLGPSHRVAFYGAAAPAFEKWRTPLGLVKVKDIRDEIGESDVIVDVPDAGVNEHSLEVQVPFLQMTLKNFDLYPLILGDLQPKLLADKLEKFCVQDDVVAVVSSDLSHYLPYDDAVMRDGRTCDAVCDLDLSVMVNDGDACGKAGVLTLMYLAKRLRWKCELLDYRNSGDTAGEKNAVVGYGAFAFYS